MIVDQIEYASEYFDRLPHLADALAFIKKNPQLGEGKHPFEGGFLMLQSGMTKAMEDGDYEAHREYMDVQILVSGREFMLWNRLENMKETVAYDAAKDKQAINGAGSILELTPGMFVVFYPSDAHKACRHLDGMESEKFEKFVVKLKL